jgi:hypothetical protein
MSTNSKSWSNGYLAGKEEERAQIKELKAIIKWQTEVLKECKESESEKREVTFLERKKVSLEHWLSEIDDAIKVGEEILK